MADSQRVITAEELERMTPNERAEAIRRSTVASLDDVSDEFRTRIEATAARLGEQRRRLV